MSDNIESLVLEQLRAIRANQDREAKDMNEVKHRLTRIEEGITAIRREHLGTQEDVYRQQNTIDDIKERLNRIERRLELSEA